uniref:MOSC_N domain-containing protein n=1 Tax=Steinernema glaseri TaxID=37863 RepID=A0A1I7Z578_9BILA
MERPHHNHSLSPEQQRCVESYSYMTPWAAVIAMFAVYTLALLWFCKRRLLSQLVLADETIRVPRICYASIGLVVGLIARI